VVRDEERVSGRDGRIVRRAVLWPRLVVGCLGAVKVVVDLVAVGTARDASQVDAVNLAANLAVGLVLIGVAVVVVWWPAQRGALHWIPVAVAGVVVVLSAVSAARGGSIGNAVWAVLGGLLLVVVSGLASRFRATEDAENSPTGQ
jgi:hypothetical protein